MALENFFEPKSIAIIGASRKEGSLGRTFFDNLIQYNYQGKVYPVNPQTDEIGGLPCYPTIDSLPEIPELAVILVRKELAIEAVNSCGIKGIKYIIMITAGFREVGGEGIKREKQLLKIIKKHRIRLIGPNCMGIINTDPEINLNASFSPTEPFIGNIALISQSGALGVAVLELSKTHQLGFSLFVSVGNKVDLTDVEFLDFIATHKKTKVTVLYQESIEKASEFRKIATKVSGHKPIIALKAGRSISGAKAATSHTGALVSSDSATKALYMQSGIIQVDTIEEMFDVASAFSTQPIPKGDKIAIITNAGGPGIIATDAIEHSQLKIARLAENTVEELKSFLPEEASVHNPIDMIASAKEQTYLKTLEVVLKDPNVDAIFLIIVRPPGNTTPRMIAESFLKIQGRNEIKPIYIILMAQHGKDSGLDVFKKLNLPVYAYPESAAHSVSKILRYDSWRNKPIDKIKKFKVDRSALLQIFESAKADKREQLRSQECLSILKAYEFPIAYSTLAQSAEEAIQIFKNLKNPIALKIESDEVIHKSDIGCVKINLNSADEIKQEFHEIMKNALEVTTGDRINGILVQEMVSEGKEVALGMSRDPNYGPMIMFGMGGIFIETFNDVSFRIAPVFESDAHDMIKSLKGYPILQGVRGEKSVNIDLIIENIQKLSQLALDWPQIEEIDLNPFKVAPQIKKCKIIDVRMRINVKK